MADFIKPSHTQSSDEIVSALNSKIAAIATLSLNDGTWTNVPIGTVAFDPASNQFKRKTAEDTWSTVEISLGIGSSLTIGTLNANSVTLLASPTSNNQTLTAASYKLLTDDVAFLKASTIELQTGTSGTDFNITTGAPSGEDLSSSSITKVINLPSASETARGVMTTGAQTIGGLKTLASGSIQLGNNSNSRKNWYITTSQNSDLSLRLYAGDYGSGQNILSIFNTGTIDDPDGDGPGVGGTRIWPIITLGSQTKIGIGTDVPNAAVTIQSGTSQAAAITFRGNNGTESTELLVGQGTDGNAFISQRANLPLYFRTNNLERVTIAADGRVGIGTTNPTTKLDLSGTTSEDIKQRIGTSSNYIELIRNGTVANTISSLGNPLIIETNDSRPVTIKTSGGERVRISENGLVGILTTTPEETLDVNGGIQSRSKLLIKSSPPFVGLIDQSSAAATNSAFLYSDQGTFYLLRGTKGSQTWSHNSTNIWPLQIDLNTNEARLGGNLLLANSSSRLGVSTLSPVAALNVVGSNTFSGHTNVSAVFQASKTTTSDAGVALGSINGNAPYIAATYLNNGTGAATALRLLTANTERIHITAAGNVGINTGSPSERLSVSGNISATGNISVGGNVYTSGSVSTSGYVAGAGLTSSIASDTGGAITLQNNLKTGNAMQRWTFYNMTGSYGNSMQLWRYNGAGTQFIQTSVWSDDGAFTHKGNIYGDAGLGLAGGITCGNDLIMQGGSPTIYLRDSDHTTSMIHCNSSIFYVLSGTGANSTTWTQKYPGADPGASSPDTTAYSYQWPLMINLDNLNFIVGGRLYVPNIRRSGGSSGTVNVSANGQIFNPGSSIRYKKDIETLQSSYADKVLDLRPVLYKSKTPTDECEPSHYSWYGLIAEEVAKIEPRLTHESYTDDSWEYVVDEKTKLQERKLKTNPTRRPEGVNYDRIGVLLIDVVRRQRDKIESLEQRLSALEALINKR